MKTILSFTDSKGKLFNILFGREISISYKMGDHYGFHGFSLDTYLQKYYKKHALGSDYYEVHTFLDKVIDLKAFI